MRGRLRQEDHLNLGERLHLLKKKRKRKEKRKMNSNGDQIDKVSRVGLAEKLKHVKNYIFPPAV